MTTTKQFDPAAMFVAELGEVETLVRDLDAKLRRLAWLRDRVAEQFAAMRHDADTLEVFTEPQAAAVLAVTPTQLMELRKRLRLPHVRLGNSVRYTKDNLRAICREMTVKEPDRK